MCIDETTELATWGKTEAGLLTDTETHEGLASVNVEYTGFLLYRGPYLLTGKCKYTKTTSEIYSTSETVACKILALKICNDEKRLLFASILKHHSTCSHMW